MKNMMLVFIFALLGTTPAFAQPAPVPMGCFKDQGDPQGTSGRDLSGHMFFAAVPPLQRITRPRTDADILSPAPSALRLPQQPAPVMSARACTTECRARGFAFGGTQYSSYCFCGNRFGQTGTSTSCTMPCIGNPGEVCGGAWANSVYWTGHNAPPAHGWTGSARCQVDVRGTGYSDSRTHTWTFVGARASQTATTEIYNAVWSVTGAGSSSAPTGSAQWTVNGGGAGPMTVLDRSDGKRAIFPNQQLVTQQNGIFGTQQLTGQNPGPIGGQASQFDFPKVEDFTTKTVLAGMSNPSVVAGSWGFRQPASAQTTAQCSWSFNLIP